MCAFPSWLMGNPRAPGEALADQPRQYGMILSGGGFLLPQHATRT